jgi:hypothetical protein
VVSGFTLRDRPYDQDRTVADARRRTRSAWRSRAAARKAKLVAVGQSGEQGLKRIESAGARASRGLKGVGRQAQLLRTVVRTFGGH